MRPMKHAGKARKDGARLILFSFALLLLPLTAGLLAAASAILFALVACAAIFVWVLFFLFCLNFFRDPTPMVPRASEAIVAPAHGTVDLIDEMTESEFMGGRCRRISTFLSVFDVHVQNSPVSGRVACLRYRAGKFFNAMRSDLSPQNENLLIGFESSERPGEKIAVRLIAGLIARRIVPWIAVGDDVDRGDRTSLIRFGSRVDLYLPLSASVQVKLGDKVKGGESIVATRGPVEKSLKRDDESSGAAHAQSLTRNESETVAEGQGRGG